MVTCAAGRTSYSPCLEVELNLHTTGEFAMRAPGQVNSQVSPKPVTLHVISNSGSTMAGQPITTTNTHNTHNTRNTPITKKKQKRSDGCDDRGFSMETLQRRRNLRNKKKNKTILWLKRKRKKKSESKESESSRVQDLCMA